MKAPVIGEPHPGRTRRRDDADVDLPIAGRLCPVLDQDPDRAPAALRAKVAVTSWASVTVTLRSPLPPHIPDHPANTDRVSGLAMSVTLLLSGSFARQVLPHLMPAGLDLTVPALCPSSTPSAGNDHRSGRDRCHRWSTDRKIRVHGRNVSGPGRLALGVPGTENEGRVGREPAAGTPRLAPRRDPVPGDSRRDGPVQAGPA